MQALIVFLLLSQQWSTPVNLGIDGIDDMYPQACRMQQMYSHTMCLVWQAYQNGNWEIYSRFTEGSIWGDTIRLTNNMPDDTRPRVACDDGGRFWCVWTRNDNIFAAYCTSGVWLSTEQITSGSPVDSDPSIFCGSSAIWVVWQRTVGDSVNIYSSYRSGTTWSAPIPVTSDVDIENATPRIIESQTRPIVVWDHDDDIYYSVYVGSSWQTPQPITSSAANDSLPEITCLNFTGTAVSWQTDAHGDWEIYRTATDTFSTHYRITNNAAADLEPCPLFYDVPIRQWDIPMIAFSSDRNGNDDIFSWIDWQGVEAIDEDPGQDIHPVLTANSIVYLWALWQTDRDGDWDIYGCYRYMPGSVGEQETKIQPILCTVFPNPFRSNVRISFEAGNLKDRSDVHIFNAVGEKIKSISIAGAPGSSAFIFWDGTDRYNRVVTPGVYFLQTETDEGRLQQKIIKID